MTKIEDCFELGTIVRTHGTKGEVMAELDTDRPNRYKKLESLYVLQNNNLVPFFIKKIAIVGNNAIICFEDIHSQTEAHRLKGCKLYLPGEALTDRGEGHFYFHEIIGYALHDEEKGFVGYITEVYNLQHSDLLAIDYNGAEALVPLADVFIKKVDKKNKIFTMALPEGLLDVYSSNSGQDDGTEENEESVD